MLNFPTSPELRLKVLNSHKAGVQLCLQEVPLNYSGQQAARSLPPAGVADPGFARQPARPRPSDRPGARDSAPRHTDTERVARSNSRRRRSASFCASSSAGKSCRGEDLPGEPNVRKKKSFDQNRVNVIKYINVFFVFTYGSTELLAFTTFSNFMLAH